MSKRRVFLVDGSGLLFRAHFAFLRNPLLTAKGENVSAIFGFLSTLLRLIREEKPEGLAVVFDVKGKTFRHDLYPQYKANRPPTPPELVEQIPRTKELLEAMGVAALELAGYEADDLIGTLALQAKKNGDEAVIVSADKDFMQLIAPGVRQWIPPRGQEPAQWIDPDQVDEKWGVRPEQMIDFLALMGDASDNVPGVGGVGAKTAARLLQEFGSLDALYKDLSRVPQKGVRAKLEKDREQAFLSRDLVTIRTDLVPPTPADALDLPDLASRPRFAEMLRDLEFRRMLESLGLEKETVWRAIYRRVGSVRELALLLSAWRRTGRPLALDTETDSLDARRAKPVGISFSWEEEIAYYVPLGHLEGENLPIEEVKPLFATILGDPEVEIVGQNLKFDLHVFASMGLPIHCRVRDTLLASYLLDSEGSHGLDALSLEHLQHRTIPISDLIGTGRDQKTMDQLAIEEVVDYAAEDADVALRLHQALQRGLEANDLIGLWLDLECPLVPVLLRMERAGVGLDSRFLGVLSKEMERGLARLTEQIHRAAGVGEFNIASPVQLSEVLFEKLGLPKKKKTKTGYSTDQEVLEALSDLHPVPRLVLEHRSLSKLKGTYVDTLPLLVDPETGRIHATFHQAVAATGRLSSSDPNIQNIPIRTEAGREIRKAFLADQGQVLISADYSQIELRILAHLSEDESLREAFRAGEDVHAATASRLFGVDRGDVDVEMRSRAKTVNFGVIYGMGPQRLSRQLGISMAEAKGFIEEYFAKMPGVRGYMDGSLEEARRDGYVTTLMGRRRILRGLNSSDPRARAQAERIAANTPIQGSAADLIKRAMIEVDRCLREADCGARMILQVHDELVIEAPESEVERVSEILVREMEGAAELAVPLQVELGIGRTWAEAHS